MENILDVERGISRKINDADFKNFYNFITHLFLKLLPLLLCSKIMTGEATV